MALPKIQLPTFNINMVSTNKKVKCRPMIVKEEKILLMAKQSGDKIDQLNAIKQVVNNCLVDKVDIENIPFFELEWLFLKIRENSISNIANVAFEDQEDKKVRPFKIDLDKVTVKFPENISNTFKLPDNIILVLKYPSVSMHTSKGFFDAKDEELLEYVICNSIESLHQGETSFNIKTTTQKELKEFVESIPSKNFAEIQMFLNNIPHLYYKLEYKNDNGTERTIELTTLDDFFTFG